MSRNITEHGQDYINNYNKTNYAQVIIRFRKDDEANVLKHLKGQDNQSEYIKNLIKEDMKADAVHPM